MAPRRHLKQLCFFFSVTKAAERPGRPTKDAAVCQLGTSLEGGDIQLLVPRIDVSRVGMCRVSPHLVVR